MASKHTHPLFMWSRDNGVKLQFLAAKTGIKAHTLTCYITRRKMPPQAVRLAFELITGGAVKADGWPAVDNE